MTYFDVYRNIDNDELACFLCIVYTSICNELVNLLNFGVPS